MMINSIGGGLHLIFNKNQILCLLLLVETMTTSWTSSSDDQTRTSVSSSTDGKIHGNGHDQASSENSLFSDSDVQLDDEQSPVTGLVQFEREPTFFISNAWIILFSLASNLVMSCMISFYS